MYKKKKIRIKKICKQGARLLHFRRMYSTKVTVMTFLVAIFAVSPLQSSEGKIFILKNSEVIILTVNTHYLEKQIYYFRNTVEPR